MNSKRKRSKVDNIPGWPGYYISPKGKLYSRRSSSTYGIFTKEWKLLKLSLDKRGYYVKHLHNNYKKRLFRVNRLVATVYIPNPDNKPCVCHKNNIRTDNRVENLYWGTHKENSRQMVMDGRSLRGIQKPLKLEKYSNKILLLWKRGYSLRRIAGMFNTTHNTVRRFLERRGYEF